jgi:hypothetical protein
MKAYWEWMYRIHIFLTSALAEGEWSASRPGRFTPGEGAPGTHFMGGWVDPRAGLDDLENRTFFSRSIRSQSLYRLRYLGSQIIPIHPLSLIISNVPLYPETKKSSVDSN